MAAFEQVKTMAEATEQHNGEFACLWHNTSLASDDTGYNRRLYARVLEYLMMMPKKELVALEN